MAAAVLLGMGLVCGLPWTASKAHAAETAWVAGPNSAARLIAAGVRGDGAALRAGVELRLDPGWKTFWRYPGDAGLPPRFDFARSTNVRSVEVGWPAPRRFETGGGVAIGYGGAVVFPLTIHPQDPARPAILAVDVSYAVCGTVCVPAEASLSLPVSPQVKVAAAAGAGGLLAAHDARVPRPVALGADAGLAITRLAVDRSAKPWRVRVDARAAPQAELFVEGPTADWALPVPGAGVPAADGTLRFEFELDGVPAGVDPAGARLTFTLVSGEGAIETTAPLD
ncbi:protein-disulfide reductase DsbD domain-containing protein [Blastochloris tepida]|uniref:protein-disulfide reductase DsbD domain-containing protein n=1 Tax=Blastochloris tepida TaxID=2233851 RepID=UPI00135A71C2|nr:protein-disulfide reductase DsbD domain-containing protein [Blastochloris tepida]